MTPIQLDSPTVEGSKVSIELDVPYQLRSYFRNTRFQVAYDRPVEDVPDGILSIPAIMTTAPVAWAAGRSVFTPVIGNTFRRELEAVQAGYADLYPDVFDADIPAVRADNIVEHELPETSQSGLLFSGGVDSIAAYLRHHDRPLAAITIRGSDVESEVSWNNVRSQTKTFTSAHEIAHRTIHSNFRSVLDYRLLNVQFRNELGRDWWGAVHYGTGLPALCAPLAYREGLVYLYQGSGYTSDPSYPTAQPVYVNKLQWAGTESQLVDVDVTRQEKLRRIASAIENGLLDPHATTVRSCYESSSGENCSTCSKCRRTILGLLVEGADPNQLGFEVDNSTLLSIRSDIESGRTQLDGLSIEFWEQIQQRADAGECYPYDDGFFNWFSTVDLRSNTTGTTNDGLLATLESASDVIIRHSPYPMDIAIERTRHSTAARLGFET